MNLIASLARNIRALTIEDPAQPLQPYSVLMDMLGMTVTDSGMLVNEKTALRQPTVLACIRVRSLLGSLPLDIYQYGPNGKRKAIEHRLYSVLHDSPNPQMTSMAWREGSEAQRQLWGNTYTEIQRDRAQRAVYLWPLPSDRTNPERTDGGLRYVTTATPDGSRRYIDPANMLHVPGLAFDGLTGISPIQLIKQTIGRALAMERFGAQYFGNGVRPSGVFTVTGGKLSEEGRENLRKSLQSAASGQNALRSLLLENGVDWKATSILPNEAQFTESMSAIVADIARGFGVPLHLIQELSRATNNNIEQQALEFIMYGLRPDAIKWEQELNRKLFPQHDYFCEHSMEGLQRGDFKTRMEGWSTLFQTGAISPNNICHVEGWNPIPAEEGGDLRFVPMNMIPLQSAAESLNSEPTDHPDEGGGGTPNDPNDPGSAEGAPKDPSAELRRTRVTAACKHLFEDATRRTLSRNARQRADHAAMQRIWQPAIQTMAEMIALCSTAQPKLTEAQTQFVERYTSDVCADSRAWQTEADAADQLADAYEVLDALISAAPASSQPAARSEKRSEPSVHVYVAPPVVNVAAPEVHPAAPAPMNLSLTLETKPGTTQKKGTVTRDADGTMQFQVEETETK